MSITADILEAMLAAGCTAKQLIAAVRADEERQKEKDAEKREATRIRVQKHRARNKGNALPALQRVTDVTLPSPEGSSPEPLSPNPHLSITPSPPKGGSVPTLQAEFDREFWPAYPHKVSKPDAFKAWSKARKRAPLESIMAGLDAYRNKTDDRPWCNPATWLNGDRWNDRPATVAQAPPRSREPTFAEFLKEKADRMEDEENGRIIETSYEHGDRQSPIRLVHGIATPQGKV